MTSEVTSDPIFELNGLYNQCPNASLALKSFSELNEAKLGAKLARSLARKKRVPGYENCNGKLKQKW